MVRTNTVILPGADAAVVRIKETRKALAMCLDGNGKFCAINPREGAKLAVAEAARNVVCVGARPIAVTNCLNFASPERPEVMWSFSEVIDGMREACEIFETPVVSGNVSFYNETEGRGILPTPVIGMVGLIEDVRKLVTHGFKNEGDFIALLGETKDDLSASEFARVIGGVSTEEMISHGKMPLIDMKLERLVQETCLKLSESGLINSAHDCSDGGLAVALAESCFSSLGRKAIGAEIYLSDSKLDVATLLFSESPSRIVVSFAPENLERVKEIIGDCPFKFIGKVSSENLRVAVNEKEILSPKIVELEKSWSSFLTTQLEQ
jgi:phosphoribosylformylglycinamidine synthase